MDHQGGGNTGGGYPCIAKCLLPSLVAWCGMGWGRKACRSLTLPILGVPGAGQGTQHPPAASDTCKGHGWDFFQRRGSEAEGTSGTRRGRQGREAPREQGREAKPSGSRRCWPQPPGEGGRCGPGAGLVDAAISADTVWRVPASPPRRPAMGTDPPPAPDPLQVPSEPGWVALALVRVQAVGPAPLWSDREQLYRAPEP